MARLLSPDAEPLFEQAVAQASVAERLPELLDDCGPHPHGQWSHND